MPVGKYTLLDLVKTSGSDATQEIINETFTLAPEFAELPARVIDKTSYSVLVRDGNPTVAFRGVNEGVPVSKASFKEKLFQTFPLDHQVVLDRALMDANGPAGFGALQVEHMAAATQASLELVSRQTYYGNPASDKGFPGLLQQYSADTAHEVDGAGSANKFSVWMLNTNTGNCGYVFGGNRASGIEVGEWNLETVLDGSGNPFKAFCNWLYGNVGFELKNKNAALRIKNLSTTDSGKGLTDALLNQAWTKALRNGNRPNAIFAPPEAIEQLRNSRTATNPTGAPAPRPTDWNGLRIIETAGISIGAAGE